MNYKPYCHHWGCKQKPVFVYFESPEHIQDLDYIDSRCDKHRHILKGARFEAGGWWKEITVDEYYAFEIVNS
jgi:hypothetical protein